MLVTHRSLISPHQPALQERHYAVHSGQELGGGLLLSVKLRDLMDVTFRSQGAVAVPPVRVHHTPRCDRFRYKGQKTLCRGIRDLPHADPSDTRPIFLSRNDNQRLSPQVPTPKTFLLSTQVSLVHLHSPRQQGAPGPNHRPTQFMQPRPGRLVSAQAQHSLQSQGAGSLLLDRHPPHRAEPQRQRRTGVLKDRSGRHRGWVRASGALAKPASQRPRSTLPATWATEAVRPPQPKEILPTGFLGGKTNFKLTEIARVVLHRATYYILCLPESTGYLNFINSENLHQR